MSDAPSRHARSPARAVSRHGEPGPATGPTPARDAAAHARSPVGAGGAGDSPGPAAGPALADWFPGKADPGVHRLVNQIEPFPLESLDSFLERSRLANYYAETTWWTALLLPPLSVPNLLRMAEHYRVMGELLGLDEGTLYGMTLHRFAAFYPPRETSGQGRALGDIDRPLVNDRWLGRYGYGRPLWQVCPLCWQEQRALFLPWSLRAVTTCPVHRVLLIDTCAHCGHRLRADRAAGACLRCGAPVEANPAPSIAGHADSLALTEIVWSALGCAGAYPPAHLAAGPDHPLRRMDPVRLLRFLERWADLLARRDPGSPLLAADRLVPGTAWDAPPDRPWVAGTWARHGVLAAVARTLVDWPAPWHETLARIGGAEGLGDMRGRRFPYTLSQQFPGPEWAWLHAAWGAFLRERAFDDPALYPWLHYQREAERAAGGPVTVLTQKEAEVRAGTGRPTLRRWMDAGLVRWVARPEGRRAGELEAMIDAGSLERFLAARDRALTADQAAARCGITARQLEMLVAAGRIAAEPTDNPGVRKVTTTLRVFLPESLDAVVRDVLSRCPRLPRPDDSIIGFQEAAYITGKHQVGFVRFVAAVEQGALAACCAPDGTGLAGLWFERDAVLAFRQRNPRLGDRPAYTERQVWQRLRCTGTTLSRWRQAGLIRAHRTYKSPTQERWEYDRADVDTFRERYLFMAAASELLEIPDAKLRWWLQHGLFPVVDGTGAPQQPYLIDREAALLWRQERLTIDEAMAMLGVSHGTINHWVQTGKLQPIPGMGERHLWFWRADIEAWAEDRITTQCVADLIGIDAARVVRWARYGKLPVLEPQGNDHRLWFSRRAILTWLDERMTIGEAAEYCGVHPLTIQHWEHTGRLSRLTAPGERPVWYARADVEQCKAEQDVLAQTDARYAARQHGSAVQGSFSRITGSDQSRKFPGRVS